MKHRSLGDGPSGVGRALGLVLIVICALLVPGLAQAARPYGVVTVDLRPEVGGVPTHLCVASHGKGPRARERLSELLVKDAKQRAAMVIDPATWGGDPSKQVCEADGECLPRVELLAGAAADDLWVACTTDSLASDSPRDPRVLIMMLEHLEGSPPLLESLKLTGGIVTIGVQADLSRIVVTARSLGGHYDAHGRAFRAEEGSDQRELVVLPIAPRCDFVEVELPGARLRESDRGRLVLRAGEAHLDPQTCVGALRGGPRMRVQLPRAEDSGRLEIELPPTEDERPTATRFAGSWDTAWPTGKLLMAPHRIAFLWSPPACVWPSRTCPAVTIEGGLSCSATPLEDGNCQYLCPGDDEEEWVELTPPLAVTFEREDPNQRWTDILQRTGQTLSSYVDREEIYLEADVSEWATKVPGNRITHVEFLEPGGGVRRYSLQEARGAWSTGEGKGKGERGRPESLRILAPGATCDPLRYTLVGDRRYKESAAAIVDGRADFGDVHQTARLLTFNVTVIQGGGPAVGYGGFPGDVRNPIYFTALGMLGANLRPRNPKWSRVAYEARVGGMIGQWGFFGPGSIGDVPRRVSNKVPWARLLFEAGVVVDVISPLSLGVSFGAGGSWPINNTDIANTNRFAFIMSPSAEARFAIRRWISLVVQGRAVFRERTNVADDIVLDTVIVRSYPNVSLLGLYGLQFSF